ncbi:DUF1028 domain-containing protein [Candidatus Marinimicrobia bacterium MT.SAG.2]|nr:DUF1028 domain-containing protein [Candidatus Marinimicrobia bacterium MT.SAG.2]
MKLLLSVTLAISIMALNLVAQPNNMRIVHTYSIVAFDKENNQMGVAVQSHYFGVGAIVTWAEPGVGVVATQSIVEVSYGPLGLSLMKAGKSAQQTLKGLLSADNTPEVRQVAMVDANGIIASHTGDKCIAEAGYKIGNGYSAQANIMLKNTVWEKMGEAYENTNGDLADRLLAALDAAQKEGGDLRGKQSAALMIVTIDPTGNVYLDRPYNLRVEDSPEPLKELRRLVYIAKAYNHVSIGDDYLAENHYNKALEEYKIGMEMLPDNVELRFWYATTLVLVDKLEESLSEFKWVFKREPIWKKLVPRLADSGFLPDDKKIIKKILKQ